MNSLWLVGALLALLVAYQAGYSRAELLKENEYAEDVAKFNNVVQEYQNELYSVEKAWLEEETKIQVVNKKQIVEVEKEVVKYVESNNLTECKYDDDRLRLISRYIKNTNN